MRWIKKNCLPLGIKNEQINVQHSAMLTKRTEFWIFMTQILLRLNRTVTWWKLGWTHNNGSTHRSKSPHFRVKPLPKLSSVHWDPLLTGPLPTGVWSCWTPTPRGRRWARAAPTTATWGICWHVEGRGIVGQCAPHLSVSTSLADAATLPLSHQLTTA